MIKVEQLFILFIVLLFLGCSPKIQPIVNKPIKSTEEPKKETPVKKFTQANVSLLIPFNLQQYNLKTATKSQISNADMALDFYQGVKMGIDSAAALGLNFKLNVLDTRDNATQISNLFKKDDLLSSNLIIGPVFPDGVKIASQLTMAKQLTLVSPLAASKPSEFDNPNLISIVNDIEQHGVKLVDYIGKHFLPQNSIVVLINPKKTIDEQFATPIKEHLRAKFPSLIVQEYTTTYAFETKMIKDKKYAVIVCSADAPFVSPSIDKLYKLKNIKAGGYNIQLFGHPNWAKQTYNTTQLQNLNTIISSSYKIDYKSASVVNFIKKYRAVYRFEPSEYAFKGFDIGYYFGTMLAKYGENFKSYLTKEKYKGLHNSFAFALDSRYGYYNTAIMLLQYKNSAFTLIN